MDIGERGLFTVSYQEVTDGLKNAIHPHFFHPPYPIAFAQVRELVSHFMSEQLRVAFIDVM